MNSVTIFYGSKKEYDKLAPSDALNLTELVMEIDSDNRNFTVEIPGQAIEPKDKPHVENFVIGSDEYAGVREHVILNFVNFLHKIDVVNLYLQNPPLSISTQIERVFPHTKIIKQNYKVISKENLKRLRDTYDDRIKGQIRVKDSLLKALYPLTTGKHTKPVVLLLYGDTGLGKTETAHLISDIIGEKMFRKQFSMFQNNQFATYVFGGAHYERSFAKDLLDRESNVILLDEFDKANSTFHSAFYQLFDEGIFEDQNYKLELKESIIVCTSNYQSIEDIKSHLGNAIFSRFDSAIKFSPLSSKAKMEIALMQYDKSLEIYDPHEKEEIIKRGIKDQLIHYCTQCDNAREIARLIDETFSKILIDGLL